MAKPRTKEAHEVLTDTFQTQNMPSKLWNKYISTPSKETQASNVLGSPHSKEREREEREREVPSLGPTGSRHPTPRSLKYGELSTFIAFEGEGNLRGDAQQLENKTN